MNLSQAEAIRDFNRRIASRSPISSAARTPISSAAQRRLLNIIVVWNRHRNFVEDGAGSSKRRISKKNFSISKI